MGKEYGWQRKLFFLHFAYFLIILIGLQGCQSHFITLRGDESISDARVFMAQGKYKTSLMLFEETLQKYPETHGDQALFRIGLIYIHPENPDRDYKKSLEAFQRLLKDYPITDLRQESVIFVSILQQIAENEKQIERLKVKYELEQKIKSERNKRIYKLQDNAASLENREEELSKQIKQLKEQIDEYKKQIEEFKKVDMEIEKKKREK